MNSGGRGMGDIWAAGIIACGGEKSCIQTTKSFGDRSFYSLEFTESYLGDMGHGQLINGECRVNIDPIIQESINTDSYYHVRLDKYGEGDIWTTEMHRNYFIVKGKNNIAFSWTLIAKRRGYEDRRLKEVFNIKPREFGGEN